MSAIPATHGDHGRHQDARIGPSSSEDDGCSMGTEDRATDQQGEGWTITGCHHDRPERDDELRHAELHNAPVHARRYHGALDTYTRVSTAARVTFRPTLTPSPEVEG